MNILYLCTHNRCRSILSEAITRYIAGDAVQAFSAGSHPVEKVHPLTLKFLEERSISTKELYSKSWDELENVKMDLVVTVCDRAANESCPLWLGEAEKLHWPLQDPSAIDSQDETVLRDAFYETMAIIEERAIKLAAIASSTLTNAEKQQALRAIE